MREVQRDNPNRNSEVAWLVTLSNPFWVHARVSIVEWEGKFKSRGMKRPFKLYRNAQI